jgi:hypothetical protein
MRSLLLVAAVATALVACGGADTSRLGPAAAPSATRTASATPTQTINVDDMMGLYATQTVFVADVDKVSAITLLNHFTRYTIATKGKAQVAADGYRTFGTPPSTNPGAWLYVLDGVEAAPVRLRTFDVSGIERASRSDIGSVASAQRALALAIDGRVLVLKSDARHAWVDAYESLTLKPQGTVMEKAGCGDRILASGSRVAIVCLAAGQIAVDTLRGGGTALIDGPKDVGPLAGATMADDGTIYAVTAGRLLAVVSPNATKFSLLPWPSEWSGSVLPDTLSVATGSNSVVLAQLADDGSWLRVFAANNLAQRQSLRLAGRLAGAPQWGVLALYPFAYFASGGSVMHVELNSGMLETMTDVGQGATIAAVVNR